MNTRIPVYSVKIKAASGTATLSDVRVYRNTGVTLCGASGAIDITNIGNASWSRLKDLMSSYDITDGFGFTGVVGGDTIQLCTVGDTDATEGVIASYPVGSTIMIGSYPEFLDKTAAGRDRVATAYEQAPTQQATIAAINDALTMACVGYGQAVFDFTFGSGGSATMAPEVTFDGGTTWKAAKSYQSTSGLSVTSTGSSYAVTAANRFYVDCAAATHVRMRATAAVAGSPSNVCYGTLIAAPWAPAPNIISGEVAIRSQNSHDSAVVAGLLQVGAEARTRDGTAVANGDAVRLLATLLGKGVIMPYAVPGQSADGLASLSTTVASDVIAAPGAGNRIYITSLTVASTAPAGTSVSIRSGTTARRTIVMPANETVTITFPTPLRLAANEALTALATFASGAVTVSANGSTAAE